MSSGYWVCTSWARDGRAAAAWWGSPRGGGSPQAACRTTPAGGTVVDTSCRGCSCDRGADLPGATLLPRVEKFWQEWQPRRAAERVDMSCLGDATGGRQGATGGAVSWARQGWRHSCDGARRLGRAETGKSAGSGRDGWCLSGCAELKLEAAWLCGEAGRAGSRMCGGGRARQRASGGADAVGVGEGTDWRAEGRRLRRLEAAVLGVRE